MATKTTSIVLGDHFSDYARRKVASGEFGSTSEVVRDALRRAEERDLQRERLLAAIDQGLASPVDEGFNIDVWFDEEFGMRSDAQHDTACGN